MDNNCVTVMMINRISLFNLIECLAGGFVSNVVLGYRCKTQQRGTQHWLNSQMHWRSYCRHREPGYATSYSPTKTYRHGWRAWRADWPSTDFLLCTRTSCCNRWRTWRSVPTTQFTAFVQLIHEPIEITCDSGMLKQYSRFPR